MVIKIILCELFYYLESRVKVESSSKLLPLDVLLTGESDLRGGLAGGMGLPVDRVTDDQVAVDA